MNIEKQIKENMESFTNLFSLPIVKTPQYVRYHDKFLKDMYDHNFTCCYKDINNQVLEEIKSIKNDLQEEHIKIETTGPNKFLDSCGFELEELIVMCKDDILNFTSKINANVSFKHASTCDIENDIIKIELKEYGNIYGEDFTKRKVHRYVSMAQEDNGLDYFAAYINNVIVGACYVYKNSDVVALDDLLVDEEYRHQYVATSLIKHVLDYYKLPIYLHADIDDSPKLMYEKLGFKCIFNTYSYGKFPELKQEEKNIIED